MNQGMPTICSHNGWKEFEGLGEGEKKLIQKQIEYQLKEIAKHIKNNGIGNIPGELDELISSLFEEHIPIIDWRSCFVCK